MTHSSVSRFLFSKSFSSLILLAIIVTLPLSLEAQEVPSSEKLVAMQLETSRLSEGWIRLFDGHTLTGWQSAGKANWRVENGAITVNEGEVGLLLTTSTWKNYELQFEFQSAHTPEDGNGGPGLVWCLVPHDAEFSGVAGRRPSHSPPPRP